MLRAEQRSQFLRQLLFYFLFCGMILQFGWQGLSLALLGVSFDLRSRVGRVPTSYPTASTRR